MDQMKSTNLILPRTPLILPRTPLILKTSSTPPEDDTSDEEELLHIPHDSDESFEESEDNDEDDIDETFSVKDGTNWSKAQMKGTKTKLKNIFRPPHSQIPGTFHVRDALDTFKLFFSNKMIDQIVLYTNIYGSNKYPRSWINCDVLEIEALLGLILFLGIKKMSMLSTIEVWDSVDGINLTRACMSRNRFSLLLSCMRFDNKATRSARRAKDIFAPFRQMWDTFMVNLRGHYIPSECVTVDEQLVPFRGRCNFIQYLPSKPDRYGIKIFWVVDTLNYFPIYGIPYLGRPLGQDRQVNLGRNTVLELVEKSNMVHSGRNVTTDNFFTDLVLAETLLKKGLTLVGTVRKNKKFLPEPFKQKKPSLPLYGSEFVFNETATLVNYQGRKNKNTVLLSTMHDDSEVQKSETQNPKKSLK